mgnify:CR=1 FL=1
MTLNYAEDAKRRRIAYAETVEVLGRAAVEFPPKMPTKLRVASFNAGGFDGQKAEEFEALVHSLQVDVAFVCETWTAENHFPKCDGFQQISHYPRPAHVRSGHFHYGCGLWVRDGFELTRIKYGDEVVGKCMWVRIDDIWFCFAYLDPNMDAEECKRIMRPRHEEDRVIILGDLNMRFGSLTGDHAWNDKGRLLAPWFPSQGYRLHPFDRPGIYTFRSRSNRDAKSIIDLAFSNFGESEGMPVYVVDNADITGAEHHLVFIDVPRTEVREGDVSGVRPRAVNLHRLKKPEYLGKYVQCIARRCNAVIGTFQQEQAILREEMYHLEDPQEIVDWMDEKLCEILLDSAEEALGRRTRPETGRMILHSEELNAAKRIRRRCFEAKKRSGSEDDRQAYNAALKVEKAAACRAKEARYRQFTEDAALMEPNELAKMINAQNKRRKRSRGSRLACDSDSLENYRRYFERQFAWRDYHQAASPMEGPLKFQEIPFSPLELAKAARWLPKAKAAGPSGICCELIREAPDCLFELLYIFFEWIWYGGVVPASWNQVMIQPVPKKGDTSLIENNRPISLTENLRKLFERLILKAMTLLVEPLDIAQGGFRERRSTLEQCASLNEMMVSHLQRTGQHLLVAFLDIKAAYDTVHRPLLWNILFKKGISRQMLSVLQALFDKNTSRIVMKGWWSAPLRHEAGVLQGSILSPMLYATFIDELAGRLRECTNLRLGDRIINSFFYADDIALCAASVDEMIESLQVCESFSREYSFRFAPLKCDVLNNGMAGLDRLKLYGENLRIKPTFPYLGMEFDKYGINPVNHVQALIPKFLECIRVLRSIGLNGYGHAIQVRRRIYECFARPKLEYGLCILPITKGIDRLLEVAQHQALAAMFSVGHSTGYTALEELAGVTPMPVRHETLNASWKARVWTLGSNFLVTHARQHSRSNPISIFKIGAEETSRTWARYNLQTRWQGHPVEQVSEEQRKDLILDIRKWREKLASRERRMKQPEQVFNISAFRMWTAREIDKIPSCQGRRILTLWIIKRLVGEPKPCTRCPHGRASARHLQECCNLNIDHLIRSGEFVEAVVAIAHASRLCLGRSYSRSLSELAAMGVTTEMPPLVPRAPPTLSLLPGGPEEAPD